MNFAGDLVSLLKCCEEYCRSCLLARANFSRVCRSANNAFINNNINTKAILKVNEAFILRSNNEGGMTVIMVPHAPEVARLC